MSLKESSISHETLGYSLYCTDILPAIACGICSELYQIFAGHRGLMIAISDISLTQKLYESSNSEVYRGDLQASGQPVIVKSLINAYSSPERLGWFWREYEVTRSLNLPGIPQVYEFSNEGNSPFFLLEDFGAESLNRLKIAEKMELLDFLNLAIAITEIISQIHEKISFIKTLTPVTLS